MESIALWAVLIGIASILYVLTVLAAEDLIGKETIYAVVMITIFMSVLAMALRPSPCPTGMANA